MSQRPYFFDQANPGEVQRIERVNIGKLNLPTRRIVACDPFVGPDTEQFTVSVQPGAYDVEIDIAHLLNGDQRIATAYVRFSPGDIAAWEMAFLEGQDPKELTQGESFCYGVDSGTGSFLSPEAGEALGRLMDKENDDLFSILGDEMEETYVHTRSWLNKVVDEATGANLVAFSSGFGDGCYTSYFGYGNDGTRICLATDFQLFNGDDQE